MPAMAVLYYGAFKDFRHQLMHGPPPLVESDEKSRNMRRPPDPRILTGIGREGQVITQ